MTTEIWYSYIKYTANGIPFYVGKGKNDRVHSLCSRSKEFLYVLRKERLRNIRTGVLFWSTEAEALQSERYLIAFFRTQGYPLVNKKRGDERPPASRYNTIVHNTRRVSISPGFTHITRINKTLFKKFGVRLPMRDIRRVSRRRGFPRGQPHSNPQFWRISEVVRWMNKNYK